MKRQEAMIKSLCSFVLILFLSCAHGASVVEWDVSNIQLPMALSDMSATFLPYVTNSKILDGNSIVIAGGCNAEKGNEFFDGPGDNDDFFFCSSISAKAYGFEPQRERFMILADMPRPRYRHAAVEINGKIWLVGGRTVPEDEIIAEIDVYDPVTDSWSTPITLPEPYQTSDNAAFVDPDHEYLYIVGGYDAIYTSLSNVWRMNVESALNSGTLDIEAVASLGTSRGDIHAVSYSSADESSPSSVFVTGGFKQICEPLRSVERYDFATQTWTTLSSSLKTARGDKALVELNGLIYAVGGETTPPSECSSPDDIPDDVLSALSLPVDDVEVYDPSIENGNWTVIADIPDFRFRFAAESWQDLGIIYGFGGQEAYDADCQCFKTSNLIFTYTPKDDKDGETSLGWMIQKKVHSVIDFVSLVLLVGMASFWII